MGRFRSLTAAVAVVGLLATGIVAFAQGPRVGPGGRARGEAFGPGGLGIPLRQLNLTEAQRTQLEQIRDQHLGEQRSSAHRLQAYGPDSGLGCAWGRNGDWTPWWE